jgi:hypothetical protein
MKFAAKVAGLVANSAQTIIMEAWTPQIKMAVKRYSAIFCFILSYRLGKSPFPFVGKLVYPIK